MELIWRHLDSWLDENPPRIGVNWASSLEVAYRAISWCWILALLVDAPWPLGLRERLLKSLEIHGSHVERYLSVYFSPNTHLTGEALGLFYIGSTLPESGSASRWRRRGAEILEAWVDRQVLPDGVYFEQALHYQRYTTEIYLHYLALARASGWDISVRVEEAVLRLCRVLRSISSGSLEIPLIGDDDGGWLLPLDGRSPRYIGGVLIAAADCLERPELSPGGSTAFAMSIFLGNRDSFGIGSGVTVQPKWQNTFFPNGGVAVLRDGWGAGDAVAVVDAGPHGAMNCGHAHADALSVVLSLGDQPVFVDRGTYTYVGSKRDEFRVTRSHNTLEFDQESSVEPKGFFQWGALPPPAAGQLLVQGDFCVFQGSAIGHVATASPSVHRRQVLHARGGAWLVVDQGKRSPESSAIVRWQLDASLVALVEDTGIVAISNPLSGRIATVYMPWSPAIAVFARAISPRFGGEVLADFIEAETDSTLRCLTLVAPGFAKVIAPTRGEGINDDTVRGLQWTDALGLNAFLPGPNVTGFTPLADWHIQADGAWWCARSREAVEPGSNSAWLAVLNPRALRLPNGVELVVKSAPGADGVRIFELHETGWLEAELVELTEMAR